MILPPALRHFRLPFPYAVVYIDRPDYVWIIAVSPFKRSRVTGASGLPNFSVSVPLEKPAA